MTQPTEPTKPEQQNQFPFQCTFLFPQGWRCQRSAGHDGEHKHPCPNPSQTEAAALAEWNKGECLWQEDDAFPPDAPTLGQELRKSSGFSYEAFKSEQLWDGGDYFIYRLISPDGKVYLQYLTYRGGGNELRHIAPSQPEASAEEEQTTPLLTGQWYHGNGVICCGTRRIARADFDTNPSWEFKNKVLGWLCETMNAIPSNLQALRDDPESDATDAAHPAWWRGEEYGAFEMVRMVEKILAGQDSGCGLKGNAKVEKARRDLISLVTALRDAEAKLAEAERERDEAQWRQLSFEKPQDREKVIFCDQRKYPSGEKIFPDVLEAYYCEEEGLWDHDNWHSPRQSKPDDWWMPMPKPPAQLAATSDLKSEGGVTP